MNRRTILKLLGLSGGGFASLIEAHPKNVPDPETGLNKFKTDEYIFYKGYKIRWSGWLLATDSNRFSGFWIANRNNDEIGYYSCTGGIADEYKLGYIFNICILKDHHFLTMNSPKEHFDEEQHRAYLKLLETIRDSPITKTN